MASMAMSYQISLRWCVRVIAFMVESEQVIIERCDQVR